MELEAYVLNTKAMSKSDVLITILTPKGLFTIYGRGYMSLKHRFHILVNRGIKVRVYGEKKGNYFRLSDCDLISSDAILTLDIELFEMYTRIVKLVLYVEHLLDETAFALFDFCVTELENYDVQLLIDLWKIFILKKENVNLNFDSCVHCGRTDSFKTLSLSDGGLVCTNCYTNQPLLNIEDIRVLNAFYNTKLSILKQGYSREVSIFLTELTMQNIGLTII
ncbi:DNA repair protein RecO [Mollicutes bacterium LVI A0039]|nr:DNA repair protein RecO [Mollicutes bacterium LVI A0039]